MINKKEKDYKNNICFFRDFFTATFYLYKLLFCRRDRKEGDTDTPSFTFITYFARAIITAISFTVLYDWFIQIARTKHINECVKLTLTLEAVQRQNYLIIWQDINDYAKKDILKRAMDLVNKFAVNDFFINMKQILKETTIKGEIAKL